MHAIVTVTFKIKHLFVILIFAQNADDKNPKEKRIEKVHMCNTFRCRMP